MVLGGSWDQRDGMLGKREELWTRTVSKVASGKRALPNGGGTFHRSASEKSSGRGPRAGAASGKRPVATRDSDGFFRLACRVRSLGLFRIRIEAFLLNLRNFSTLKSQNQISLAKSVNLP